MCVCSGLLPQKNHLKETAQTSALDKLLSLPELSCRILNFSAMEQVHFASLRKYVFIPPLGTVGDPIYMCYTCIVDSAIYICMIVRHLG